MQSWANILFLCLFSASKLPTQNPANLKKSVLSNWDNSINVLLLQKRKKMVVGVHFLLSNFIFSCSLSFTAFSIGSCSTTVAINGDDVELSVGERFTLNCVFTCLEMQYLAQLQKNSRNQVVQKYFKGFPTFIICADRHHAFSALTFNILLIKKSLKCYNMCPLVVKDDHNSFSYMVHFDTEKKV